MNRPPTLSLKEIQDFFAEYVPLFGDCKVVFGQLLESIAIVESQGSAAWSISPWNNGFRLNVGQVEALTFDISNHDPESSPSKVSTHAAQVRLMLTGEDCLSKIEPSEESASIAEINYKPVGEKNWVYWGTFEIGGTGAPTASRALVVSQLTALRSNHESFLRLACRTPTGKIRQKSNYTQHHCPAMYEYAKLVMTMEDGGPNNGSGSKETSKTAEVDYLRQAAEAEVFNDPKAAGVGETTRLALVEARIGQGTYRSDLLALWEGSCALTGCAIDAILVASHAKSWADAENNERLDPYNGFLFVAHVDKLFDRGLISFDDTGAMLVAKVIDLAELKRIGLSTTDRLRTVDGRHLPYLKAHRQRFGFE